VAAVPGSNRYLGTQYRPTNNNNNNTLQFAYINKTKSIGHHSHNLGNKPKFPFIRAFNDFYSIIYMPPFINLNITGAT
jgi:hypothetical protein